MRGVDPNGEIRTASVTEEGEVRVRVAGISGPGGEPGVQYNEGEQDVTITGTAVMWEGDNDTLQPISKTTPLPVQMAGLLNAVDELEAKIQALSDRIPGAGTKPASGSFPVVLSSDGPFSTNFGTSAEPPADSDTANSSFLRLFKRLLQSVTSRLPSQQGRLAVIPRTVTKKFRDDFPGNALDLSKWEIVQTGAGQSISVSNSELTISSGTTPNSETIIRSRDTYTIAFRIFAVLRLTQRIINQEFYLELVDASGQHSAQLLFDGTNTTNAKFQSANGGSSIGASTITGMGQSQFFQVVEIDSFIDEINAVSRLSDSTTSRVPGIVRTRQIPDPNLEYYVQIRAKNLATAPASSTSFIFDSIAVQDIEEITAEVTGGRGGGNANQAIPVQLTSNNQVLVAGGSTPVNVGDSIRTFLETNTVLAANATFLNTGRSTAHFNTSANSCRGWVLTDQPGTLIIEHSGNGSTWRQTHSWAVPVSNPNAFIFDFKLHSGSYRVRYVNGPTAQSVMEIYTNLFFIGA